MRLLFWRKPKAAIGAASAAATPSATRQRTPSPRSEPNTEPSHALAFARAYLQAIGARTTAATPSVLSARLPDGREVRYTDSPAEALRDLPTEVLLPGGAALTAMLEDVAAHARLVAFRLPPAANVETAIRQAFAPPAKNCGRCLATSGEPLDACDACPLLAGSHALGGLGRIASTRVLREWEGAGVELAFAVTARDHYGRIDDLVRVAFDTSGAATPVVPDLALARAEDRPAPADVERRLAAALPLARGEIERRANAVAAFLSLRGSADYARRRDEITGAFTAMRAESKADHAALTRAHTKEMTRLVDVHGVEVSAHLAGAAFITTTLAEIELQDDAHHTLHATLDLGRGLVHSATWDAPEGSAAPPTLPVPARQPAAKAASLTADALDLLPPAAFAECLRWLLERAGIVIDSSREADNGLRIHGTRDGRPLTALALATPPAAALSARDVRRASALALADKNTTILLICSRPAADTALAEAQRLSVELWDRGILDSLLADQAETYERAARQRTAGIEARIAVAAEIRAQALQAVEAMEAVLADPRSDEKLRTRPKIAPAVAATEQGKLAVLRSLLACQTLVADLRAAFGERPARDGSLEIMATAATLDDLLARIEHLAPVAIAAAREVAAQPVNGDFGYSAWRKAVTEELTARCESVRWRVLALDPAKWREYGKALDAHAATQSDVSAAAADRAATRVAHLAAEINARALASS
jgi:hypothetical protein